VIAMSLELTLIPLALAAIDAATSVNSQGGSLLIESRFKDLELLQKALENVDFENKVLVTQNNGRDVEALVVRNQRLSFSFVRSEEGNFTTVFPPGSERKSAESVLEEITREYGRILQNNLIQRIERSAAASGFRLGSRNVNQDRSVTLTLGVA
jgi:hypothetical protein